MVHNVCHALIVKGPKALSHENDTKESSLLLLIPFFDRDCYPRCRSYSSKFFFLHVKDALKIGKLLRAVQWEFIFFMNKNATSEDKHIRLFENN